MTLLKTISKNRGSSMKSSRRKRENHQKTDDIYSEPNKQAFTEIVTLIQSARQTALASVNITLIDLYWQVGEVISHRISTDSWGKGTVRALASYILSLIHISEP